MIEKPTYSEISIAKKCSMLLWMLRRSYTTATPFYTISIIGSIVLALIPPVQVYLMAKLASAITDDNIQETLLPVGVATVALIGITPSLTSIVETMHERATERVRARLNSLNLEQVERLSVEDYVQGGASSIVEKNSHVIDEHAAYLLSNVTRSASSLGSSGILVVSVFVIDSRAGIFVILAMIPPLLSARYISGIWMKRWEVLAPELDRERYLREQVVRTRSGAELASLGTISRISRLISGCWSSIDRIYGSALKPRLLSDILAGIATVILLGLSAWMIVDRTGNSPLLIAGIYAVISATAAVASTGQSFGLVLEGVPLAVEMSQWLHLSSDQQRTVQRGPVQEVTIRDVSYSYRSSERPALERINISASAGELVAVVGENGAGKTTLMNTIIGAINPDVGEVSIDGIRIDGRDPREVAGYFGLLTQEFGRYELTVRELVNLGTPYDADDDDIWRALNSANIAELVESFPSRLDQQIGEQFGGIGVSGGQWQRFALARIYLRSAPIWILDEPTSSIDAPTERKIFNELAATGTHRVTIVVTHRASTLGAADRIYVMEHGRIVEQGSYDFLRNHGTRFRHIFLNEAAT